MAKKPVQAKVKPVAKPVAEPAPEKEVEAIDAAVEEVTDVAVDDAVVIAPEIDDNTPTVIQSDDVFGVPPETAPLPNPNPVERRPRSTIGSSEIPLTQLNRKSQEVQAGNNKALTDLHRTARTAIDRAFGHDISSGRRPVTPQAGTALAQAKHDAAKAAWVAKNKQ